MRERKQLNIVLLAKGTAISLLNQRMCRSIVLKIKKKKNKITQLRGQQCRVFQDDPVSSNWNIFDIIKSLQIYLLIGPEIYFFLIFFPGNIFTYHNYFSILYLLVQFCDYLGFFTFLTDKLLLNFLLPSFCEWTMQRRMRFSIGIFFFILQEGIKTCF